MKNKIKKSKQGIYLIVVLVFLAISWIFSSWILPERAIDLEITNITKIVCEDQQVEIGQKLVDIETVACSKVVHRPIWIGGYFTVGGTWTIIDSGIENPKDHSMDCYEIEKHFDEYPCTTSYCKFGDGTVVKDEKYEYELGVFEPIYDMRERCIEVEVEEMIAGDTLNRTEITSEYLETNCKFVPDSNIDPWICPGYYTIYI